MGKLILAHSPIKPIHELAEINISLQKPSDIIIFGLYENEELVSITKKPNLDVVQEAFTGFKYVMLNAEHEAFPHLQEFLNILLQDNKEEKVCMLCNKKFTGHGCNPEPLTKGVCCNDCDKTRVIPERIRRIQNN